MKTLTEHLKALSYGKFVNNENHFCQVSTGYNKSKLEIRIYFCQENGIADKYAVMTTSVKKAEKILNDGNYELIN